MIGRIAGTIILSQPPQLMIDCHGVGYEIEVPLSVFFDLPPVGEQVVLITHLVVLENAHRLYGFSSTAQRAMFRELIKVTGVGAKMAIAILSGLSAEEFSQCIADHDVATLTRLPGIGKKTADRLIVELEDRLAKLPTASGVPTSGAAESAGGSHQGQAVAALEALGFKNAEARKMVKSATGNTVEEIIRDALKGMSQ